MIVKNYLEENERESEGEGSRKVLYHWNIVVKKRFRFAVVVMI